MHPCDVFSDNVEFQIDHRASFYLAEIGMFKRVRNNRHFETVIRWCTHRKTNAIYGNRTFIYRQVTFFRYFFIEIVPESVVPAAAGFGNIGANGSLINVSLHDVPV